MSWKKKALEMALSSEGISWRKIAKVLGKPKSTVSDFLRGAIKHEKMYDVDTGHSGAKVLLFDIETSMIKAYTWGLWQQNISIDAIIDDWYVICWSAQWLHEDKMMNASVHTAGNFKKKLRKNEAHLVLSLWKLLDEADIVIAYNGKKFDKKKMNTKFLEYGLPEPSPYKIIDPYITVKRNFALTSNKMDFVARYMQDIDEGKTSTNLKLWIRSMEDDVDALQEMQDYCDQDIVVLREVHMATRHWDKSSGVNMALYEDSDAMICRTCGSSHLIPLPSTVKMTAGEYEVFRCGDCQTVQRGRQSLTSTSKRKQLTASV
jgi:hypothetical protein